MGYVSLREGKINKKNMPYTLPETISLTLKTDSVEIQRNPIGISPIFQLLHMSQGQSTPYIGDKLIPPLIGNPDNGAL